MADIIIQPGTVYLAMVLVGVFSGLGNAIGQYIFAEHIKNNIHKFNWWRKK